MDIVVDMVVALIASAALVVAVLSNRNASRSADASQDSAREAKRSADAAERQAAPPRDVRGRRGGRRRSQEVGKTAHEIDSVNCGLSFARHPWLQRDVCAAIMGS
jgi:hypothetical protein